MTDDSRTVADGDLTVDLHVARQSWRNGLEVQNWPAAWTITFAASPDDRCAVCGEPMDEDRNCRWYNGETMYWHPSCADLDWRRHD